MLKLKNIISAFENEVPKALQWEKDNSGLQIGDPEQDISRVLLSLEVTQEIVEESKREKSELIITHHPLLFNPIKKIDQSDEIGKIIVNLIRHNISLYSAHTNLDKFKNGVSYSLAKKLNLKNIEILSNDQDIDYKIATFVPEDHVEKVTNALVKAGAGKIGEYEYCSFRSKGQGTFRGSGNTNPYSGISGKNEFVEEIRLEMIFPKWKMNNVIFELKSSHPYEEVAYDIYPLRNQSNNYGLGVVGDVKKEYSSYEFLELIKETLKIPVLRISGNKNKSIRRVAIVGGAGIKYLNDAISNGSDLFITSDITYHDFHDAQNKIIIVDAGHYETEIPVLDDLKNLIQNMFNDELEIIKTKNTTNPISYF